MKRFFLILALLFIASAAFAIPQQIYFQGLLLDDNNDPVTGSHVFTFRIYDAASGGSQLWQETHTSVPVSNGLYTVKLGSVTSFPAGVFEGDTRYIGIQVDSDAEMSPRVQLLSVPYAHRAAVADALSGGGVGEFVRVAGDTMTGTLTMGAGVIRSNVADSPGASAFHLITNNPINSNAGASGYYIPTASLFSVTSAVSTSPAFSVLQTSDTIHWRGYKIPAYASYVPRDFYVLAGDPGGDPQVIMGFLSDPNCSLSIKDSGRIDAQSDIFDFGSATIESSLMPADDVTYNIGGEGASWKEVYAGSYHGDGSQLTGIYTSGEASGTFVKKTGDTMTGTLTISSSSLGIQAFATQTGPSANPNYGGFFVASGEADYAVYGDASATGASVQNYGGYFVAEGDDGIGVFGRAPRDGTNYGGYFWATGVTGRGVHGRASGAGVNYGGYFTTQSQFGYGLVATSEGNSAYKYSALLATPDYAGQFRGDITVEGAAYIGGKLTVVGTIDPVAILLKPLSADTKAIQVRNTSDTDDLLYFSQGEGLTVNTTNSSGTSGYFTASGISASGVRGDASDTDSANFGGSFSAAGQYGIGVKGIASHAFGANYGGYFQSFSTSGTGVYGYASAASGPNYGGYFSTKSPGGVGLLATNEAIGSGYYWSELATPSYAGHFVGNVSIEGTAYISELLSIQPTSSCPITSGTPEGTVWYDAIARKLKVYTSSWEALN